MSDLKISQLPVLASASSGDLLAIVNAGITKQITFTNLFSGYLALAGGTMTGNILFSGTTGIDTTSAGGSDTLPIGVTNADIINIGRSASITYLYSSELNITDKLITLNKGGASTSATGTGFEIEENSAISGYFKTNSARTGFSLKAPANTYYGDLLTSALSANRSYTLPDANGTFIVGTLTTGYALVSSGGAIAESAVTSTELGYVSGVTSAIQTQLNAKQDLDTQLTSLAALSYTGNALKVIRVNAGETGFELATPSGSITGSGTTNEITYWTSSSDIGSLTTATYPSLTELSYVKGVTSAIQTQLNTKVSGSLTSGRVPYASGSTTLTDSANMVFTGSFLGLGGTGTPAATLEIKDATAGGQLTQMRLRLNALAHGFTGIVPTDVYAIHGWWNGSTGGYFMGGLSKDGATPGYVFIGYSGATGSVTAGCMEFRGAKRSGTSTTALSATDVMIVYSNNATTVATMLGNGALRLGDTSSPTALLHLAAGTSSLAQIKLESSTLLGTPAAGAIEFASDNLYYTTTTGTTRKTILGMVYRGITSNRTLDGSDELVVVTSGTVTVTLPTAVGFTGKYTVKNLSSNAVTINTTSSQTVDGYASGIVVVNTTDFMTFRSNGSNWIITG